MSNDNTSPDTYFISNAGCYCRRATRGAEGRPTLLFFKNRKKVPWFWKKGSNCVHPWVKSSIQNVVLRVSRGKSSKTFPCRTFFLVFLTKSLSKCFNSTKSPLPQKILVARQYCMSIFKLTNFLYILCYKKEYTVFEPNSQCYGWKRWKKRVEQSKEDTITPMVCTSSLIAA